jgi:hypothetical protein
MQNVIATLESDDHIHDHDPLLKRIHLGLHARIQQDSPRILAINQGNNVLISKVREVNFKTQNATAHWRGYADRAKRYRRM